MPSHSFGRKLAVFSALIAGVVLGIGLIQRSVGATKAKSARAEVGRPAPAVDTKNPLVVTPRGTGTVTIPAGFTKVPVPAGLTTKIKHIVVIYQENWSFDGLYAKFPGANGAPPGSAAAAAAAPQIDVYNNNAPLTSVPQPLNQQVPNNFNTPLVVDPNFPAGTFDFKPYALPTSFPTLITGDIIHRFYTEQGQIDGGKNDKFVTLSDNPGLVMSQVDASTLPEGVLATKYVMCDNYFHAAFGGSFLNHQYLVAAQAPNFQSAATTFPALIQPKTGNIVNGNDGFDAKGNPTPTKGSLGQSGNIDDQVTTDGFAVNTLYTVNNPHPIGTANGRLVPNQTYPHIGDKLDGVGASWAWYAGGWNDALAGNPDPNFQFHHQPFAFFADLADGTVGKAIHLKDESQFLLDLAEENNFAGTVPHVSFIKCLGPNNEHPGYAALLAGQNHVNFLVNAIQQSPIWKDCVIIITYDEHGGRWDHVAPPGPGSATLSPYDRFGPGVRVPAIVISPFTTAGTVDKTAYDTTSILGLIETVFATGPLVPGVTREQFVNPLVNWFNNAGTNNATPTPAVALQAIASPTYQNASSVAKGGPVVNFSETLFIPPGIPNLVPANPAGFQWDFGDTTTGTGSLISHSYTTTGSFTATLKVVTTNGNFSSSVVVFVNPAAAALSPSAVASPNPANAGQTVNFVAGASSPTAGATLTFTWNFGDGSATATGASVTHVYTTAGTYPAMVTITDGVNPAVTSSVTVTVVSTPLTSATGTYSIKTGKGKLAITLTLPTGTTLTGTQAVTVNGTALANPLVFKTSGGQGKNGDSFKFARKSTTTGVLTIASVSGKTFFGANFVAGGVSPIAIGFAGTTYTGNIALTAKGKTNLTAKNQ